MVWLNHPHDSSFAKSDKRSLIKMMSQYGVEFLPNIFQFFKKQPYFEVFR